MPVSIFTASDGSGDVPSIDKLGIISPQTRHRSAAPGLESLTLSKVLQCGHCTQVMATIPCGRERYSSAAGPAGETQYLEKPSCRPGLLERLVRRGQPHVQQGVRPPLLVQLRPPFLDEPARLVEAAGRCVLLVDIHRQLAMQCLGMQDQPPTGAAALELWGEEQ